MAIVSVSLPDALLGEADAFIEARGFAGRSDIVRSALRDFLARERASMEGGGARARTATLTLLYPDGYERKIGEIRHEYGDIVRSMMHGHVPATTSGGDEMCVEVFMLEGQARRLQEFADALRGAKETRLVQLVPTTTGR
jgi:CopG family transcriptional regulator, nickel-responsive regulator